MAGLIITNGDSAAGLLAAAGRADTVLAWQDVLHEGPIVAGALEECSAVRGQYLAGRFRLDLSDVAAQFAERDAVLRNHAAYETVELWFEHDLYDQLQLVQLLSFFAEEPQREGLLLVQADDFLGRERAETILRFADKARPVGEDDLERGEEVWADLTMPTPEPLARRMGDGSTPDDGLPFLAPALHRFLEEMPAPRSGLNRTEATALGVLKAGPQRVFELFRTILRSEEAAFMGDASFFAVLDDLAFASSPLIAGLPARSVEVAPGDRRYAEAMVSLTTTGEAVLDGRADHVRLNGVDRWWAGTRLEGRSVWRYDREEMALVPPGKGGA